MKLVLSAEGIKREIEGPFQMCASRQDVQRLANILNHLLRDDASSPFSYGWFQVDDGVDVPTNTPPRPWRES